MSEGNEQPIIGLTVGDPAGIGPEIVIKALQNDEARASIKSVVYADRAILQQALDTLKIDWTLNAVDHPSAGRFEKGCVDFVDCGILDGPIAYGEISADGGHAGYGYLNRAIDGALSGDVVGLATAPLNKESLQAAKVPHIDHTSVLNERAAHRLPMTLFVVRKMKIFFLTRHLSFREIADAITHDSIVEYLPLCDLYLRQLGADDPVLAVAALNPHGGEQGLFGREEMEVIQPAVAEAQKQGLNVRGPVPADSVFHQALEGRYDGVLSLYHDQGHIASKTVDFHGTVSFTMGLKFLRTSVDHGTAFDIAGTGIADAHGMVETMKAAGQYAQVVRDRLDMEPIV
ncbi:MAG: 4-hydroxythreonine-4-phosphate dehydrogenase PdxA [Candidatus Latescibacteria bacterium]|nr:4-hydroxythreonine-4-phosphate dehydrogenase PdxA [Candidatus Latescibacterota bacterium]MBT4139455.1 4-hydroxythreonine-4-phosphate dehydrogenase PdxA [Candidatus Latescibacterota bacterium]MBT5831927.1 4-hydroxythreonine-4-phosphate dehydrogenase PdxA [Candidatus Latescibacterota bacterium]